MVPILGQRVLVALQQLVRCCDYFRWLMTSAELNDLTPAPQEKLEWVTPKITLMEPDITAGSGKRYQNALENGGCILPDTCTGPS